MVPEMSKVYWFTADQLPPTSLNGRDIMIFSSITNSTQIVPWDSAIGFPQDVIRWARIPQWKPNLEIVINRSFGRFAISSLCRQELGITADESDPYYISDAEIRQDWRWSKPLVAAVKKLGFLASAPGANLEVVEVPGCYAVTDLIITDRNGYESVTVCNEGECE